MCSFYSDSLYNPFYVLRSFRICHTVSALPVIRSNLFFHFGFRLLVTESDSPIWPQSNILQNLLRLWRNVRFLRIEEGPVLDLWSSHQDSRLTVVLRDEGGIVYQWGIIRDISSDTVFLTLRKKGSSCDSRNDSVGETLLKLWNPHTFSSKKSVFVTPVNYHFVTFKLLSPDSTPFITCPFYLPFFYDLDSRGFLFRSDRVSSCVVFLA